MGYELTNRVQKIDSECVETGICGVGHAWISESQKANLELMNPTQSPEDLTVTTSKVCIYWPHKDLKSN